MTKREVLYTLLTKDWKLKRIEEDRQNHKIYKFRKNDYYCSIYIIRVFIGSFDLKVKPYNNPIILDLDTITKKQLKRALKNTENEPIIRRIKNYILTTKLCAFLSLFLISTLINLLFLLLNKYYFIAAVSGGFIMSVILTLTNHNNKKWF